MICKLLYHLLYTITYKSNEDFLSDPGREMGIVQRGLGINIECQGLKCVWKVHLCNLGFLSSVCQKDHMVEQQQQLLIGITFKIETFLWRTRKTNEIVARREKTSTYNEVNRSH